VSGYHAVVLAAGAGSRFGGGKLLAPFRGGVLLDSALAAALAAPVQGVVLVTGADAARVTEHVGTQPRLSVVHAADHAEGMAASLRTGLAALPAEAEGVLVFLGDMPDVPEDVSGQLIAALARGAAAAVPVFDRRRGHPVAFARRLFPELSRLQGDQGGRAVLARLGDGLAEVAAPGPGVLADVDTPQDLQALA
jgi:molybdenum cofactor cytidylyltransferase